MVDILPDLCDKYQNKIRWIPIQWLSFGTKSFFWGEIVTLRCFEDNSFVRQLLSQSGKGKVLIIDGHASLHHALLGDQLGLLAIKNDWEGVIILGAVRDVETLNTLSIGIKSLGVCPLKTDKKDRGEINVVLTFADIPVYPGDYVYADKNGVIVSRDVLSFE